MRAPPSASSRSAGCVKHVAATESQWLEFALHGAPAFGQGSVDWADGFRLTPDETLPQVLEEYDRVAARTDRLVVEAPDLAVAHPLPEAPWFPPGASWSLRPVLLHVVAETAQHAGHADILRESLDGQKTMG